MDADTKYLEEFSVFGWSTISYPVGVEHSSDQSVEDELPEPDGDVESPTKSRQ